MMDQPTVLEAVDIAAILKMLPHRDPFLMIDRVHSMRGDEFAIGVKNVTINEPQFLGHFPERPVFPGVLMIEGMAQTAGIACIASGKTPANSKSIYFMTVDKAKFRKPVLPGDTLDQDGEPPQHVVVPRRGQGGGRDRGGGRSRGADRLEQFSFWRSVVMAGFVPASMSFFAPSGHAVTIGNIC